MAVEQFTPISTNIDSAEFDPDARTITVTFLRNGESYVVPDATADEWRRFQLAPSAGKFYNENFRSRV